jgi:peptidoglycan hydrolase-like protein with peptidoglycan-binding domain
MRNNPTGARFWRLARSGKLAIIALLLVVNVQSAGAVEPSCPPARPDAATAIDRPRPLDLQFNLVRAVARKLRDQGYAEPADGIFYDELKKAIAEAQRKAQLPQTGILDCKTVEAILGVDLGQRAN